MASSTRPAPVLSVVNMKGGVGKTTITANVFYEVFYLHKVSTLLIDYDPQYNLTQLLLNQRQYEDLQANGRTVWRVMSAPEPITIFDVSEKDLRRLDAVSEYVSSRWVVANPSANLDLLPGDFRMAMLNLREDAATLRRTRDRFIDFISSARSAYDVVVLDCNPSSSFLTRTALEVSTHLVIPFKADRFSMLGLEMIMDYLDMIPGISKKPQAMIVINNAGGSKTSAAYIDRLRRHDVFGPMTLSNTVKYSGVLSYPSDYTGFSAHRPVAHRENVRKMLQLVASEIASRIGISK